MKLDSDDLNFLIGQGEGYNLEFKESFSAGISKEICAFANTNGGKILLGVTDKGTIKGIGDTNPLRSRIQDLARNMDPSLNIIVDANDVGNVVIIDVPEGKSKPYSAGGKFFMRYGANSQQLTSDEIRAFFQKEGLLLFDEKPNMVFNVGRDLDGERFKHFLERAKISRVLENEDILENLCLLEGGNLKNAGVLMFCRKVAKFIPQATITCVLYQGNSKYKILDRKEYDEDLYSNFFNANNYVQSKLNTEFIIKGGPREEKLELPEEALREALLNAIAHRDYFVRGANILVEIFSDRVEITNPGGLVNGLTMDDLGKRSLSRNNLLFGLMQRMDLIEKVGSGILRMRNAMNEYGLKGPRFDVNDNWFTIIYDRPVDMWSEGSQKSSQKVFTLLEEKILTEIKKDPRVSRKRIAEALEINEYTVKEYIDKLVQKEAIERIGPAKGGYWEVKIADTTQKTPQKTTQKTPQKTPQKILTGLEEKILNEIRNDSRISRKRIAKVLEINEYTVKEYLEKLVQKRVIERVGPAKGGYWEVK